MTSCRRPVVACIGGTRPEVIKLAPLAAALDRAGAESILLAVGQHPDLIDGALGAFALSRVEHLVLDRGGRGLAGLAAHLLLAIEGWIEVRQPDVVVVQGDTATTLAAALAAHWSQRPVVHLEAGLRSGSLDKPFPEEGNRRLVTQVSSLHLAPTGRAARALVRCGIPASDIRVVGNTVVDAVLAVAPADHRPRFEHPYVVVTAHRRESWGEPLLRVADGVASLARALPNRRFLVPLHPNPEVRRGLVPALSPLPNVQLIEPLGYRAFVDRLARCSLVITDSGGIQEEAAALGLPLLIARGETERNEVVECGGARLVGTEAARIASEGRRVLTDPAVWQRMHEARCPFGDGTAAVQAADATLRLVDAYGR